MGEWVLSVQGLFGIAVLLGLAWSLSEDREAVDWRMVAVALGMQALLAVVLLTVPPIRAALLGASGVIGAIKSATDEGAHYVFGYLARGPFPFEVTDEGASFVLAFQVLPLVIVVSALAALLWHWRVLPLVTRAFAAALSRGLNVGGAAGFGVAVNLFMGIVEAPLFVRAYLHSMSRSELFLVMSAGMATVSGVVFVLYATVLEPVVPGAVAHILTASIISLPAVVMMARILVPGDAATPVAEGEASLHYESSIEAIVQGTQDGLQLFLTVLAVLLVLVAFVAMADQLLGLLPAIGGEALSVRRVFGWIFAPIVWLFGVPWAEAGTAGALMGTKTVLNEFFAYLDMAALPPEALSDRTKLIMLYAMCGFANLGSVGMLISTITTFAPERRAEVTALGLRALLAGTLATGTTGAIVGLLPS